MSEARRAVWSRGGPLRSSPCRAARLISSAVLAGALVLSIPPRSIAEVSRAVVEVEMLEFAFRPQLLHLRSGVPVRLVLRNRGLIAHQLETDYLQHVAVRLSNEALYVEAPGLHLVRLNPGGRARVDLLPRQRGRFTFACTIEGHREAGMRGILEVK